MARLRRLIAAALLVVGASLPLSSRACVADPQCITGSPPPSGPPRTPAPTPLPTPAPTPSRTATPAPPPPRHRAPALPAAPAPVPSIAEVTPFPLETSAPSTPTIEVQPLAGGDQQTFNAQYAGVSVSSWIFGFIVGLIVGGIAGRASWGLRKRRRQQIFG